MFTFNKKKKYFIKRIDGIQKMIWDNEFKREKTLMIREEVRNEYDAVCSKLHILIEQINSYLIDPTKICEVHNPEEGKESVHKDKGTCTCERKESTPEFIANIEGLYDKKTLLMRDKTRYEGQMNGLDVEVYGTKPSNEYPDGVEGIDQTLDALRELMGMTKEYLKKI